MAHGELSQAALPARSISIAIDCPFADAYEFTHRSESFAVWAKGISSLLHREGGCWLAQTRLGEATVEFSPRNDYGALDHWVTLPGQRAIYIPVRLVANGSGTEVVFMLFRQPEMDDAAFERDAHLVEKDLSALKSVLERATAGSEPSHDQLSYSALSPSNAKLSRSYPGNEAYP